MGGIHFSCDKAHLAASQEGGKNMKRLKGLLLGALLSLTALGGAFIVFFALSILLLIAGLVVLFLLLKKRNEDDDGNGGESKEPVKAMSIASLPLVILTSHYLDIPYLILYAIAGLTILVWLIDLVVAIYKRYRKTHPKPVANNVQIEEAPLAEAKESDDEAKKRLHKSFAERLEEEKIPETEATSFEDNTDGDEVMMSQDENGNAIEIRYLKSFTAKLSQADEALKDYYNSLKNYVLSYKGVQSKVSWHYDSVVLGRERVLKFAIRGKTLCAYYPLDPKKVAQKYKVEEAKGKKFEEVPCLYRIRNERRCQYAKDLFDRMMKKRKIQKGKELNDEYRIPFEETKVLIAKGLIKEVKKRR